MKIGASKKLLGVIIDNELSFTEHVSKMLKKQVKFHTLVRISSYISTN